jgi:hypothetical protein
MSCSPLEIDQSLRFLTIMLLPSQSIDPSAIPRFRVQKRLQLGLLCRSSFMGTTESKAGHGRLALVEQQLGRRCETHHFILIYLFSSTLVSKVCRLLLRSERMKPFAQKPRLARATAVWKHHCHGCSLGCEWFVLDVLCELAQRERVKVRTGGASRRLTQRVF